jgi:hypothetical protein
MQQVIFSISIFGYFFPPWLLVQITLLEVALRSIVSLLLDIISKATRGSDKNNIRDTSGF